MQDTRFDKELKEKTKHKHRKAYSHEITMVILHQLPLNPIHNPKLETPDIKTSDITLLYIDASNKSIDS
jgi:hypothetical protein